MLRAIRERLALLSGRDDEIAALACREAQALLTARLREGMTPEKCADSFTTACALIAMELLDRWSSPNVRAYTAGAVSVRLDEKGGELIRTALELMGPYLDDGGFWFRGVRGS